MPDPNTSYSVLNTEKKPVYTCQTYLQYIKTLTLAQLHTLAHEAIPMNLLPWAFIEDLNSDFKKKYCYQLCLVCWNATNKTQCPKLLQLEFACAYETGHFSGSWHWIWQDLGVRSSSNA
ncbi:hypothetical protein K435DRAFT_869253 [Dendrothele bispora CBS 962.96]|uniref:Uncharacterized protein n=1 Tax=Dendrothele bispora (strain CBS 962.96) TaxID=1314807 RepID=A0A4S8L9K5_DENBC|nr:hypothetical protein K435DRAFT_869253 [Dendrothele bispora CBS 962.96]